MSIRATEAPAMKAHGSGAHRRRPRRPTRRRSSRDNLNFYYGAKRALRRHHDLHLGANLVTALHRAVGLRQEHVPAHAEPDERHHPGHARRGHGAASTAQDIYAPRVDVVELRRRVGMVFQKSNPFPKSIFENVAYGLRINGLAASRARAATSASRRACSSAALWDEVKDRLHDVGAGAVRRPAAAAVHRARAGGRAGDPADGRAGVGARSDRDAAHRGADLPAEDAATRSSS